MPKTPHSRDIVDEIEQFSAMLASETSPAIAVKELRRIADELEEMRPTRN
jgi:hypothetical protein